MRVGVSTRADTAGVALWQTLLSSTEERWTPHWKVE